MKNFKLLAFGVCLIMQCTNTKKYDPSLILSPQEKDQFIMKIIHLVAKAPENVSQADRFKSEYDAYYLERASQCFLEQYYVEDEIHYFLVSQPAPSIVEKRQGTGGKFKFDKGGNFQDYEEVFRTWKMVPDTLRERGKFLFDKMVSNESLEPFYAKSAGDKYIEFPDDNTYYDKSSMLWKTK